MTDAMRSVKRASAPGLAPQHTRAGSARATADAIRTAAAERAASVDKEDGVAAKTAPWAFPESWCVEGVQRARAARTPAASDGRGRLKGERESSAHTK